MTDKPKGGFTPGANLNPEQIVRVLAFVTCKGETNAETITNMAKFFGKPTDG